MHRATQIELVRRAFAHLDAGTTDLAAEITRNPISAYTNPAWLAREQATLFRQYPLFMGLSGRIAEPGDYVAENLAGLPVLLVRGDDGTARAFVNQCRHRGAPVAKNRGHTHGFSCPYHAWRYDRAGRLLAIPDQRSFPGIECAKRGLMPLPLVERAGLLWVLPDAQGRLDAALLDAHLCGVDEDLISLRLAGYYHYESRMLERSANWKMPIDTFLEPYHFTALHRDTVAPIFFPQPLLVRRFRTPSPRGGAPPQHRTTAPAARHRMGFRPPFCNLLSAVPQLRVRAAGRPRRDLADVSGERSS